LAKWVLRKIAKKDGVDVRGILYVFDLLLGLEIISPKDAYNKLLKLSEINDRLPQKEIDERLALWIS
jgi:hypothetical protein